MYKNIFALKNWAVVGASENNVKFGCKIFKFLKSNGYNVYPVNPGLENVFGEKCYKSVKDIPEKIDVVNVVVPVHAALNVVDDTKEAGIENIWLQPGSNAKNVIEKAKSLNLNVIDACVFTEYCSKDMD